METLPIALKGNSWNNRIIPLRRNYMAVFSIFCRDAPQIVPFFPIFVLNFSHFRSAMCEVLAFALRKLPNPGNRQSVFLTFQVYFDV